MNDVKNLKPSTEVILKELVSRYPDQTEFRKQQIVDVGQSFGYKGKDYGPIFDADNRVKIGTYDLAGLIVPLQREATPAVVASIPREAAQMQSIVNEEKTFATTDKTFVPWGNYHDIVKIIKSGMFYPTYISGLSGNGKTFMVEQACAKLGKEFIRVQINPETDEDDLIGGFRLVDGNTVWHNGPVLEALQRGAVLLLDELDLASNKILCLQSILEGNGVFIKKIGKQVYPEKGFTVVATANTKGKGSDDGRFVGTNVLNEAFLERFPLTFEQEYPSIKIEQKLLHNYCSELNCCDDEYIENLGTWAEIIRKTFKEGGVDEVISTRRLVHIIRAFAIFKDRLKAIKLCLNRFDDETKAAFLELYSKIDAKVDLGETPLDIDAE